MVKQVLRQNLSQNISKNFIPRLNREILIYSQFCRFFNVKIDHGDIFCNSCGQTILKFCPYCGSTSILKERGFAVCYNCKMVIEENLKM